LLIYGHGCGGENTELVSVSECRNAEDHRRTFAEITAQTKRRAGELTEVKPSGSD
jgi:hypothetical protein